MAVLVSRIRFVRALKYRLYALLWIGQTISNLGDGAYYTALAWLVLLLTGSATAMGIVVTASAIGSIIAVLIVGQMKQMHSRGMKAYLSLIGTSLALAVMGFPLPRASEPFVALEAEVIIGFGLGFFNVIWFTVLQQLIPGDKLGRVSSIDMMGSLCLTPIGFALGGIVTDHIGPRLVFIGCGLISALLSVIALTVHGVRQLD